MIAVRWALLTSLPNCQLANAEILFVSVKSGSASAATIHVKLITRAAATAKLLLQTLLR